MSQEVTMTQVRVETSRVLVYLYQLGVAFKSLQILASIVGMEVMQDEETGHLIFAIPQVEGEEIPSMDGMHVHSVNVPGRLQ